MPSTANDPAQVAAQYATEQHLRVRINTHRDHTEGPDLERVIDAALHLRGDEALLDVGTGPGDFPARLQAGGHQGRLVGLDLSEGMVQQARGRHSGLEFVCAGADHLPFPDATFDVVTARHMLYHVPNVPAVLTDVHRVLRPGGRFLAVTNASTYLAGLWAAVDEAAAQEPALRSLALEQGSHAQAFSELNGERWVAETFGNAEVQLVHSALKFHAVDPVLAYLETFTAWHHLTQEQRGQGRDALSQVLTGRVKHGAWRVSKPVALIRAARL